MSYLTEGWPLGPTSTIYMDGSAMYSVREYGKPGVVAWVNLPPEHAEAIRHVVNNRIENLAFELLGQADMLANFPNSERDIAVADGLYAAAEILRREAQ